MNDIFKIFKKRAQAGKGTNIADVIKGLNEKEQNEIIGSDVGRFERGSKSYLSISKSGRVKSKKTQKSSRILNEEFFNPTSNHNSEIIMGRNSNYSNDGNSANRSKTVYDQYSDNVDSSATSSFLSSLEDLSDRDKQRYLKKKEITHTSHNICKNNANEKDMSYTNFTLMIHKNI
jgi:hypothetical protein